jgi:hypothetical protein
MSFFRRKLINIALKCYHDVGPWLPQPIYSSMIRRKNVKKVAGFALEYCYFMQNFIMPLFFKKSVQMRIGNSQYLKIRNGMF